MSNVGKYIRSLGLGVAVLANACSKEPTANTASTKRVELEVIARQASKPLAKDTVVPDMEKNVRVIQPRVTKIETVELSNLESSEPSQRRIIMLLYDAKKAESKETSQKFREILNKLEPNNKAQYLYKESGGKTYTDIFFGDFKKSTLDKLLSACQEAGLDEPLICSPDGAARIFTNEGWGQVPDIKN